MSAASAPNHRDLRVLWREHRTTVAFTAIIVVLGAHTLRNWNLPLYLTAYTFAALGSVVAFVRSPWRTRLAEQGTTFLVWCSLAVFAAGTTFFVTSPSSAVTGLTRFLFAAPTFLALVGFTRDRAHLLRHIYVILGVFTLQTWTLPAQVLTGPWPFFAKPTVRAGVTRYASAVGSLTALGIIVGCYLVLCQLVKWRYRWLTIIALVIPAIISLSKAAALNIVLALLIIMWVNRGRPRFLIPGFLSALAGMAALGLLFPSMLTRVSRLMLSFVAPSSMLTDDSGVSDSTWERLTILPAQNWQALLNLPPIAMLSGGGYAFGDSALVGPGQGIGYMAHNQYGEIFTVFGLLGGLILTGLLALCGLATWRQSHHSGDPLFTTAALCWGMLALNSLTANGTLYQPAAGIIVYLLMFISVAAPSVVSEYVPEDPHDLARATARPAATLADRTARVRHSRRGRPGAGPGNAVAPRQYDHFPA